MYGPVYDEASSEEFRNDYQEKTSDLVTALLPHLMRIMPDWREYEAMATSDPASTPDQTLDS